MLQVSLTRYTRLSLIVERAFAGSHFPHFYPMRTALLDRGADFPMAFGKEMREL